ncbi:MAG: DUF2461 domain-containing protein [Luteibaculaceae bacterium]
MPYFTKEFSNFFTELKDSNHKEWFDANRTRYEQHVKKPFYHFLTDLIEAVKKYEPYLTLAPKDVVFRINRDIRFSKDKSPYKNNVAAVLCKYGKKDGGYPGLYVHFEANSVMLASGVWAPSKEELYAIRWAISENPTTLRKLMADKTFVKVCGEIKGEKNVRIEQEFMDEIKQTPELLFKQLYYEKIMPVDVLFQENLVETVMDFYKAVQPLNQYFGAIVEASRNS